MTLHINDLHKAVEFGSVHHFAEDENLIIIINKPLERETNIYIETSN